MRRAALAFLVLSLFALVGGSRNASAATPAKAAATTSDSVGVVLTGDPSALKQLGVSWYLTYGVDSRPVPSGMHRVVVLRLNQAPDTTSLLAAVKANPGTAWLLGNEPNVTGPSSDGLTPAQYATYLHDLSASIKQADSTALIVGPNVLNAVDVCTLCAGYPLGLDWTKQFYAAYQSAYGTRPPLDRWALHTYDQDWQHTPTLDTQFYYRQINAYRDYLDTLSAEQGVPLWDTEMGVMWAFPGWTISGGLLQPAGAYQTNAVNNWVAAMVNGITGTGTPFGVERTFLFAQDAPPDPGEGAYGGVNFLQDNTATARPTPAGLTLQAMLTQTPAPQAAAMTTPVGGGTIGNGGVTLGWGTGTGASSYWLAIGTVGPGTADVYNNNPGNTGTVTIPNIPPGTGTVYVRLFSIINGVWQYTDASYSETGTSQAAAITSPTPGSTLTGPSVTFQFSGVGVTRYRLYAGTKGVGSSDVYSAPAFPADTIPQADVTNIPMGGATLYVRLYSLVNSAWSYSDYTFVEAGSVQPAVMTSPAGGSQISFGSVTFQWGLSPSASSYWMAIGTVGAGTADIYNADPGKTGTVTIPNIPPGSGTVYVRLFSRIGGAWQYTDSSYKETGAAQAATITSPAPGSALTGASATFQFSGVGVTRYRLYLGTQGPGSFNIYTPAAFPADQTTSVQVNNIPTTGGTLYARLYSLVNSAWVYQDYTFTESTTP
jgi:hypothetical protein